MAAQADGKKGKSKRQESPACPLFKGPGGVTGTKKYYLLNAQNQYIFHDSANTGLGATLILPKCPRLNPTFPRSEISRLFVSLQYKICL